MLEQLQPVAVFFSSLVYRYDGTSQRRELAKFFLNILKALVTLSVSNLVHGTTALLPPILFILLVNLGNFRP